MTQQDTRSEKATGMLLVLAWVSVGFGVLGILSPIFTLGSRGLTQALNRMTENPMLLRIDQIMWSGTYGTWMTIGMGLGALLGVVLLVAGLGFRNRRPWAQQLLTLYAVFQVALVLANLAVTFTVLVPAMRALATEFASDPVARVGITTSVPSAVAGCLFGLALPAGLMLLLRRRDVQEQLGTLASAQSL